MHRWLINNQSMNIHCLFWECRPEAIMTMIASQVEGPRGQSDELGNSRISHPSKRDSLSLLFKLFLFWMGTLTVLIKIYGFTVWNTIVKYGRLKFMYVFLWLCKQSYSNWHNWLEKSRSLSNMSLKFYC